MKIRFKKFSEHAIVPSYARAGDSGADLFVASLGEFQGPLFPGETRVYWTDIGIELAEVLGLEAQVRPRSSVSKRGLLVHLGTVDSGYRGNIGITITNASRDAQVIKVGDRIAQLVLVPVARGIAFEEVEELSETERGQGGYGSTDTLVMSLAESALKSRDDKLTMAKELSDELWDAHAQGDMERISAAIYELRQSFRAG